MTVSITQTHEKETLQFQPRSTTDFWFACIDIDVIRDKSLSLCDKTVFSVICTHVNVQTRDCSLRVKTIAEEANCSVRSVQESLKALTLRGIIERIECFENGKQKASTYKIVGHRAPCYDGDTKRSAPPDDETKRSTPLVPGGSPAYRGANTAPSAKNSVPRGADYAPTSESCTGRGAENDVLSLLEPNTNDIKNTSPSERGTEKNPRESDDKQMLQEDFFDFDDIPPAMMETLDYFLLKTGRGRIQREEVSALRALEEIHTPGRVNKEISHAVERFRKQGKPLEQLTLVYIFKSLQFQVSLKSVMEKKSLKGDSFEKDPYEGCYL